MELRAFFETIYLDERDLAQQSARQLRLSLNHFIRFCGYEVLIDRLDHSHLNRWCSSISHLSPRTIKRRLQDVLCVWDYAYSVGVTENAPNRKRVRSVRISKRLPEAWTLEQLRSMTNSAATFTDVLPNGVIRGNALTAAICTGFYSALRASDLMRLSRCQVASGVGAVQQAKRRGDEVLVRLPEWFIAWINEAYPKKETRIVAWPHRLEYFYDAWDKMLLRANLPIGRTEKLQKLRRTSVTYGELAQRGFGAQLAGHAPGTRTTYDSYADPRILLGESTISLPRI